MRRSAQLKALRKITSVKYEAEQAALQTLLTQEANLRSELARLKELMQNTRADAMAPNEMRAIGADVLWQGWIGRSMATLNIRLAAILAQKEMRMNALRQAFGKARVVEEMITNSKKAQRQSNDRSLMDNVLDQHLQR